MCGIFGHICRSQVSLQRVLQLLRILERHKFRDQGERDPVGGHGAGVGFLNEAGEIVVFKVGRRGASPALALSSVREVANADSNIVLGHVRYASPDLMDTIEHATAAQPYRANCIGSLEVISVHNGKVENFVQIREQLSAQHRFESEAVKLVDSEVIPHLFEESLRVSAEEAVARETTLSSIEGNNTAVLLTKCDRRMQLHLLHKGSTRGIHFWMNPEGEIIFCSREEPVQRVFRDLLDEHGFRRELSVSWKQCEVMQRSFDIPR